MDALSYALKLDNSSFVFGMASSKDGLAKMEAMMTRATGGMGNLSGGADRATSAMEKLGSGIGGVVSAGAKLAGIGVGLAATAAGAAAFKAFDLAKDMEQTSVAFKTMVGDGAKAEELLGRLKVFSDSTPFEFPELADAGRKLLAFGESADTIPDSLRRIGDVASGIQAPIGEIAEIYGKARVQGTLFAEDINQLTGRGIPVLQEFANITGKSVEEIKGMASEGQITFPMLEQAFMNLTGAGGKFHGMMQEQSKTSAGMLSTLGDAVNSMMMAFGKPINDAIKPWLEDAVELAGRVPPILANGVAVIQGIFANGSLGDVVASSLKLGFMEGTNYGVGAMMYIGSALRDTLEFAMLRALRIFDAESMASMIKWREGMDTVFAGLGKLAVARIGGGLVEGAITFEKAVNSGLEKAAAKLVTIFVPLADLLGVDDAIHKLTAGFQNAHIATLEAWLPANLEQEAADTIRRGMEKASEAGKQIWDGAAEDFGKAFENLEFKPVEIFKEGEIERVKSTMSELAKGADPTAWENLQKSMEALHAPLAKAKDTAEAVGKEMAVGINDAIAAANKVKDPLEKSKNPAKEVGENLAKGMHVALGAASQIEQKLQGMLGDIKAAVANFGKPGQAAIDKRAKEFEAAGADPAKAKGLAKADIAVGKASDKEASSSHEQTSQERQDRRDERLGDQIERASKYLDKIEKLDEKTIERMSKPLGISKEAWQAAKDISAKAIADKADKAGKAAAGAKPPKPDDPAKDTAATLKSLLAEVQGMRAGLNAFTTA